MPEGGPDHWASGQLRQPGAVHRALTDESSGLAAGQAQLLPMATHRGGGGGERLSCLPPRLSSPKDAA